MKGKKNFFNGLLNIIFVIVVAAVLPANAIAEDNPFGGLLGGSKICFPHIAVYNGWETEVALINATPDPVKGQLTAYDFAGTQLSEVKTVSLNPMGRKQFLVSKEFSKPDQIDYLIFESDVFGVKGYTKFYRAENRVSIMASGPRTAGVFTKIDHEGYTGIAFVNVENFKATVTLTAYSDAGKVISAASLTLEPGEKKVNVVESFFCCENIDEASYVTYASDRGIVAFFLNGTNDGTMLDGSQAQ